MRQYQEGEEFLEAIELADPEHVSLLWEGPSTCRRWPRSATRTPGCPGWPTCGPPPADAAAAAVADGRGPPARRRRRCRGRPARPAARSRRRARPSPARCRGAPTRWPCWCWPWPPGAWSPPSTSTTGCGPGRRPRPTWCGRRPARLGAGFRAERVEVEPGPNLEARARAARYGGAAGRRPHRPHRRRPGRDGAAQPAAGRRPRRAGRHAPPGPAARSSACAATRRGRCAGPWAWRRSTTRPTPTPPTAATGSATSCCPCSTPSPSATWSPSWPARPPLLRDEAELLDGLAAGLDPTDARALAAAPVALARRAVRRWLAAGCEHPPDAAAVERVLAVARGEAKAADVGGGRRVARTGQRLRDCERSACTHVAGSAASSGPLRGAGTSFGARGAHRRQSRPDPNVGPVVVSEEAAPHPDRRARASRSPTTTRTGRRSCWSACSRAPSCS